MQATRLPLGPPERQRESDEGCGNRTDQDRCFGLIVVSPPETRAGSPNPRRETLIEVKIRPHSRVRRRGEFVIKSS
jgi:hypothetical protein